MIKGFEEQTKELTQYEEEVLMPLFIKGLKGKIGKEKAVTNAHIVKTLRAKGYEVTGARVRKIIHELRVRRIIKGLKATSEGYYIVTTEQEIIDYQEGLLRRQNAIKAIWFSLEQDRIEMFHNTQAKIF